MRHAELKTSVSSTTYVVDGKAYASLNDVPEQARRMIEAAGVVGVSSVPATSYVVDGRTYESLDQMPEDDRGRFALGQLLIDETARGSATGGFPAATDLMASVRVLRDEPSAFEIKTGSPTTSDLSPGEAPQSRSTVWRLVVLGVLAVIAYLLLR